MKRLLLIGLAIYLSGPQAFSQEKFLTVAEKSDYKSTSDYKDVMTFIDQLKKTSDYIRVENIATSVEGREIPLFLWIAIQQTDRIMWNR